ncbi:MAG: hypothetical protein AAF722_01220 [Cyanobacteria bacterium P01_C01_bin.70]
MSISTLPLATNSAQAQALDLDYDACADQLLNAGVDADAAAIACALSYRPTEVSGCVSSVLNAADVTPTAALSACSRDRRPDEVASCVSSIHGDLVVSDSQSVLDHCHRTILPERYAACVTGISDEIGYATEDALASCIAAGYRPENVTPTYIPMN